MDGRIPENKAFCCERQELQDIDESQYHVILNHANDPVFIHHLPRDRNVPEKFIEVNDAAVSALGYTKEELLRMSLADIVAPDTAALTPANMETLLRDKRAIWEGTYVSKDGRRIPVETHNVLFYLHRRPVIVSTARDITKRTQAQEEIRRKAQELKFIAEHVGDIIWQMDSSVYFTYVSPAIERILGYPPSEVVGRNLFSFLTPRGAEKVSAVWLEWYRQLSAGEQRDELLFEMETVRKDGRILWMEVQARPLIDRTGGIIQYHGVSRDITQRRQGEQERRQLQERLARAEKMESLGILAGGVAHDLNNVMGVIVGYAELLSRKMPPDDTLNRYAANILKSSEKSAAIISDLLTLGRRGVTVRQLINLNAVVMEYLQSPEFEKLKTYHPGTVFTADLARDVMSIEAAPVHIGKTVMNLMSNAAEAIAADGNVTIRTQRCSFDKPQPGYEEIQPGDYVVLTVSDDGQGISREDIGKIFEPFYTKKVMGRSGTGLGLAVVWGTVKDHGGYIDVQTGEGKGSSFSVFFPAASGEIASDDRKTEPASYKGRGESILVVDDVPDQREVSAAMLKNLGYSVRTVSGGEEAMAFLRNQSVDLVVIDMIMAPGMDGLDTYREIIRIRPGQKAIIVSGFSETDRIREARQLGVGAYLHKPYTLEKIGQAIRSELDR
ncbi:MAG: PAS domain-containing sensor histidine kinase [Deltaproteobacteria bacterium]|nr:PAS domain-containing sensor histidine kinase [Deltaproteobacteria bacterium]